MNEYNNYNMSDTRNYIICSSFLLKKDGAEIYQEGLFKFITATLFVVHSFLCSSFGVICCLADSLNILNILYILVAIFKTYDVHCISTPKIIRLHKDPFKNTKSLLSKSFTFT